VARLFHFLGESTEHLTSLTNVGLEVITAVVMKIYVYKIQRTPLNASGLSKGCVVFNFRAGNKNERRIINHVDEGNVFHRVCLEYA
jgi:hypothetical protein